MLGWIEIPKKKEEKKTLKTSNFVWRIVRRVFLWKNIRNRFRVESWKHFQTMNAASGLSRARLCYGSRGRNRVESPPHRVFNPRRAGLPVCRHRRLVRRPHFVTLRSSRGGYYPLHLLSIPYGYGASAGSVAEVSSRWKLLGNGVHFYTWVNGAKMADVIKSVIARSQATCKTNILYYS